MDRVNSRSGDDTVNGCAGDDFLNGGTGADVFVFSGQWGDDTLVYFDDGADKLQMVGLDMGDLTIEQVFGNVVISHGNDTITLSGVSMASLDASDFIFS